MEVLHEQTLDSTEIPYFNMEHYKRIGYSMIQTGATFNTNFVYDGVVGATVSDTGQYFHSEVIKGRFYTIQFTGTVDPACKIQIIGFK